MAIADDFGDASTKSSTMAILYLAAGKVNIFDSSKLFRARKSLPTCKTFTHFAGKVGVRAT